MSLRCLPGLALLVLAFSVCAHAQSQSLGDLARQIRAERQQSGAPRAPVITNDDIASTPAPAEQASKQTAQNEADTESPEPAKAAKPPAASENANVAAQVAESSNSNLKINSKESEIDRRTAEINQRYLDRIAAIRKQINTAQQELAKLLQEQAVSTFEYRRTLGVFPNPGEYAEQQRVLNEQIQAKGELITNLNSALDDAKEAARHAGVPHALDL